ncbi:uncharacterized protein LOC106653075 [Trichogramma pretiosum]|uniref:uncharacterized protein LOC106653075 n=1 Tax=Trichogramma pretiosum TaxID=7493 RepID=UPI0006C9B940|nr:uncharacterized protein LOC106653075 [Trichogramma pretiosum]XP_023318299.1 uncharacterized protein LOC106653075 [Trichogramma pretiosum]
MNHITSPNRSKSTLDMLRAASFERRNNELNVHHQLPQQTTSFTLRRPALNQEFSKQRKPLNPAAVRSDDVNRRSYVEDEQLRRNFESNFGSLMESTAGGENKLQQQAPKGLFFSPRSSSFVRRLVASLEKQRDLISPKYNKNINCRPSATADVRDTRQVHPSKLPVPVNGLSYVNPIDKFDNYTATFTGYATTQQQSDNDAYSTCSDDSSSDFWDNTEKNSHLSDQHQQRVAKSVKNAGTVNRANDKTPTKAKKTFKSMLSSLKRWKPGQGKTSNCKNLPKGTRDYYATRESLGDELHAFRQNTMSRLYERSDRKFNNQNEQLPFIKEQKEFNELLQQQRAPRQEQHQGLFDNVATATVKPIYGQKRRSRNTDEEYARIDALERFDHHEVAPPTSKLNVQEKAPSPVKYESVETQCPSPSEHLVRPSKIRDMEKRLSRELDMNLVQLRKANPMSHSGSQNDYDVPRCIKTNSASFKTSPDWLQPLYANVNTIAIEATDDRQPEMIARPLLKFTTF